MGEGGHRHPLLTAGPQQLVQDGQHVQAYLENQVGKEEEDAGPQQSFEDAAGVTCDTRAELSPSTKDTPAGCWVTPQAELGRVHCAQRFQGSAPGSGSHQGFALTQHSPRAPQEPKPRTTLHVPAAPSWHLPGPAGPGPHQGALSIPIPAGTSRGRAPGVPPTPNPISPSSSSCSRAPIPPGSPGPVPVFLARGGVGSEPTTAASRPGGGPGPAAFPRLFFPVNPRKGSQRQRRDPGPCEPMKYSQGKAFSCGRARSRGWAQHRARGATGTCPGLGDP